MSGERRIEVASSAWIGNPEDLFGIVGQINKGRSEDRHIGVELYPVAHRLPISERTAARTPFLKDHLYAFRDGKISLDRIHQWQRDYGSVPVERIHLPFHWSIPSGLYNYCIHSVFKEPGRGNDRMIATAVAYMTMTVMNNFATRLAGELEPRATLNAHVNIIEEAEKRGKIGKIGGKARGILVENDLDYPRKYPFQIQNERDVGRAISAVERNHLEGLILGIDHAYRAHLDPRDDFLDFEQDLRRHVRTLHLSGSKEDHGLITDDDYEFWDVMDFVKVEVSPDVSFCLDLNPQQMAQKSLGGQYQYLRELVEKLEQY